MKLLRHTSGMQADTWEVQPPGITKPPTVEKGQLCASGRRRRERLRDRAVLCPTPGQGEVAGEEQSRAVLGNAWASVGGGRGVDSSRALQTQVLKGCECGCRPRWECAPALVEECESLPPSS